IPPGRPVGAGMPGPTDDVQVAVSAAAGRTDVTVASSIASTNAMTFATDSTRMWPNPPVLTARTRLGRARHAPRRIDERDPRLTRLEEQLLPRRVEEREHVEDPVALPRAVHAQPVAEDGHRAAAGHPVVEALGAQAVLGDA